MHKNSMSDKGLSQIGAVTLVVTPVPGNWGAPPIVRLRRLLKAMGRGYGFRCLHVRELPAEVPELKSGEGEHPIRESSGPSPGAGYHAEASRFHARESQISKNAPISSGIVENAYE